MVQILSTERYDTRDSEIPPTAVGGIWNFLCKTVGNLQY